MRIRVGTNFKSDDVPELEIVAGTNTALGAVQTAAELVQVTVSATGGGGGGGEFENIGKDWYVGTGGDNSDGRSPLTAFTTYAAVMSHVAAIDTVHLCSDLTETIVPQCHLNGHGFLVTAPSTSADCIQISAVQDGLVFEHLRTTLPANSTGRGIFWAGTNNCRLSNWGHTSLGTPDGTVGGDGFFGTHSEGNLIEHVTMHGCNNALHLCEEFTTSTFNNVNSNGQYRNIYIDGVTTFHLSANATSGGCTFIRFKGTNGVPADHTIWVQNNANGGGNSTNNVFIHCDWSEDGSGTQDILFESGSSGNTFINQNNAAAFNLYGGGNIFDNCVNDNILNIYGSGNMVRNYSGSLVFIGSGNYFLPLQGVGTSYWHGFPAGAGLAAGTAIEQFRRIHTVPFVVNVVVDISAGNVQHMTATSNANINIGSPVMFDQQFIPEGWEMFFIISNTSGGATGTFNFNAKYIFTAGAYASPATGKSKTYHFLSDGSGNMIELSRTADY